MLRQYTLKKPAERHARIGAFYACLLPMIIGLMMLGGHIGSTIDLRTAVTLPIAIGLIFGTPIVAWLSQDTLKRREQIDYLNLMEIALLRATILQFLFGTLCIIYLYQSQNMFEFKSLLSACLTVHTIIWVLVTLPVTLICCVIFKLSALRPIYR